MDTSSTGKSRIRSNCRRYRWVHRARVLRGLTTINVVALLLCLSFPAAQTRAFAAAAPVHSSTAATAWGADIQSIQAYLLQHATAINAGVPQLVAASHTYYALARTAKFNYTQLWKSRAGAAGAAIQQARAAWLTLHAQYEQAHSLFAGLPSLQDEDIALDSGTPINPGIGVIVPFDLHLPDGRVLHRPGNLFGILESTLWGTFAAYTIPNVSMDQGKRGFGEAVPDASILEAAADAFAVHAAKLLAAAKSVHLVMLSIYDALMDDMQSMPDALYEWRTSRFVLGDRTTERAAVARSRLADIADRLLGLDFLYSRGMSPFAHRTDAKRDALFSQPLQQLHTLTVRLLAREQGGTRFTSEEANLVSTDVANRLTALEGQLTQLATELKLSISTCQY